MGGRAQDELLGVWECEECNAQGLGREGRAGNGRVGGRGRVVSLWHRTGPPSITVTQEGGSRLGEGAPQTLAHPA